MVQGLGNKAWRRLRDLAGQNLRRKGGAKSSNKTGYVLLKLVNKFFRGRLLIMSTEDCLSGLPLSEEVRKRLMVNSIDVPLYLTDHEGRLTYYNDAAATLWGYQPKLGEARWNGALRLYTADEQVLEHDDCSMAITLRTGQPMVGIEAIAERPDGSRVSFISHPKPLHDASGRLLGGVNVLVDVSQFKDAQRRQILLAREVDHRAKNLLAVVQSLARLSRAEGTAHLAEAFEGRLVALANAHALLAADNWDGADLRSVIEREMSVVPGRFLIKGDPMRLTTVAVQPMSMLLHELATNAVKYGALSVPEGRVTISWERTADGAVLKWCEAGGPKVVEPLKKGFGSRLIHSLGKQVNGTVSKEWLSNGLICTAVIGTGCIQRSYVIGRRVA